MTRIERWMGWVTQRRVLVHGAAVAWLTAAAVALLAPALSHGISLGPTDLLSGVGLTSRPGVVVHNATSSDQIQQLIPWTMLAWRQVHHGQLPLWNPYSLLGMPLAFNWSSAPFSIPTLIGYLLPMNAAYTASIVVRLIIAGTGGYFLGRVMGMGWLGSTFTGTVFELSGPIAGWAAWPQANVLDWTGWALAATLLLLRGRHRTRDTVFLAVTVGLAGYGGHPESIVILLFFLVVAAIALVIGRAVRNGAAELYLGFNVILALLTGIALAAPVILPGIETIRASARSAATGFQALPADTIVGFVFSTFYGQPLVGSTWFGPLNYYEINAYIGVIALVLGGVALLRHWKELEVQAVAVVGLVMLAVIYFPPVRSILNAFPGTMEIDWDRALMVAALPIAVLAGLGLDQLVGGGSQRRTLIATFAGFAICALALMLLAGVQVESGLKGFERTIREDSFLWPLGATAIGLLVVIFLWLQLSSHPGGPAGVIFRSRWFAGMVLLVAESAFLVSAGAALWSASPTMLPNSPAVTTLGRIVGSSTVGFASCSSVGGYADQGILPDANVGYSVSELADYDPIVPSGYYKLWSSATGTHSPPPGTNVFCPSITSARLARLFGVAYVLQKTGGPPVAGAQFDRRIDGEDLYRVPGAARATLVRVRSPEIGPVGTPVAVTNPDPATWRMAVYATGDRDLRMRLTDLPGWHATIDGKPLALKRWADIMLEAQIPPGHHIVVLHYEPSSFTVGLVVLAIAIVLIVAAMTVPLIIRRRRRRM